MDILDAIVAHKREEVANQKQALSAEQLSERLSAEPLTACRSMKQALESSSSGIIAEFKRRSPSKGWLSPDAQPSDIVTAYEQGGAAAVSILTDEHFFGGTPQDLQRARSRVEIPLLRKDFVIDEYQLLQARLWGADAVLLIAAILSPQECRQLSGRAHELGLEVLLEVHEARELTYLNPDVDMLGVNNRHLGTFDTTVEHSFQMVEQMVRCVQASGREVLMVSESGLQRAETIRRLRGYGFRGFLMGEYFMKIGMPGQTLSELIAAVQETKA